MARTQTTAAPFVPADHHLGTLAAAAAGCRGCELWAPATRVVFGAGPGTARLLLVGEQPGDVEDRRGEPFVGPAGKVLDAALDAAGVDRAEVYLTNAVKHFSHRVQGARRIHQRPTRGQITACHPWLEAELDAVRPAVVGLLGLVACESVLGPKVKLESLRGAVLTLPDGRPGVATYHPSAILRAPDERRAELRAALVEDLARMAALLAA